MKWAQRSDKIFLTVELPDAKDVKVNLDPEGKFSFFATKDSFPYEVDFELFDKINVKVKHEYKFLSLVLLATVIMIIGLQQESKVNIGARSIVYVVKKLEKKWWNRLLKEEGKSPGYLKVDWDKWIDEDDENGKVEQN